MPKLKTSCRAVNRLEQPVIDDMFRLFSQYYNNIDAAQFKADLLEKDHVFLFLDPDKRVQGFSTVVTLEQEVQGKKVRALFSGDTVMHRDYWGQGALSTAFGKYFFLKKLKSPWQPLYWFLISKGYKTYLLMTNNFPTHYPRYDKPTPPFMQAMMDAFGKRLYPEHYNAEEGLIQFSQQQVKQKDCLKDDITPITEEMLTNSRIAFFAEKNPHWDAGDELACVAELSFMVPFTHGIKNMRKQLRRKLRKRPQQKTSQA